MKHFLFSLAISILFTSSLFAQKKISVYQLDNIRGLFIQRNTVGPFTGTAIEDHSNGKKKLRIDIKAGKAHGLFRQWAKNGKKIYEVKYINGQKSGIETQWYATGAKKSEMNFVNGQADGRYIEWYKNKKKKSEGIFKNGLEEGKHQWWYKTGQLQQQANYKNGLEEGLVQNWFLSGQLRLESNYKNGKKEGITTEWFGNGIKKSVTNFANNVEDGEAKSWSKKGILVGIQTFQAGRLIKDINYRSGAINIGTGYVQVFNEKESFFKVDILGEKIVPRSSVELIYSVDGKFFQLFNYAIKNYFEKDLTINTTKEILEAFVEKEKSYISKMTKSTIEVQKEFGKTDSGLDYIYWHFISPSSLAKEQKARTVQQEHYISIVCNQQILSLYSVVTNSDTPLAISNMLKKIAATVTLSKERIDLNELTRNIIEKN